jgi:RNA polymerase sigma factor (TIGR02999 family)
MGNLQPVVAHMLEQLQSESTKKYQEYLLGGLEPRQRENIARLILTDEKVFNELLAAEESLIEGYLNDTLPTYVHSRLAKLLVSSRVWRQKIKLARALKTVAGRKAKADPMQARNDLFEGAVVHLENLARQFLRRQRPGTFEPSDLVNETYIRLRSRSANVDEMSKQAFFALAAQTMRRVLIDHARAASRARTETQVPLQVDLPKSEHDVESLLDLDIALTELTTKDARQGRLVELICFGGLTVDQAAESLGVSVRTARRLWDTARAWLFLRIRRRPVG